MIIYPAALAVTTMLGAWVATTFCPIMYFSMVGAKVAVIEGTTAAAAVADCGPVTATAARTAVVTAFVASSSSSSSSSGSFVVSFVVVGVVEGVVGQVPGFLPSAESTRACAICVCEGGKKLTVDWKTLSGLSVPTPVKIP